MSTKQCIGQKYKNKQAYTIRYNETQEKVNNKAKMDVLCNRCHEQIEWKKKYDKYKKMTGLSRCNICQLKNIYKSYRHACDPCARQKKICAKCLQSVDEYKIDPTKQKKKEEEEKEQEDYMSTVKERSKRSIKRLLEKDAIYWDNDQKCFVDIETEEPYDYVRFKKEYDPDYKEGDKNDDDSDDMIDSNMLKLKDDSDDFTDDDSEEDKKKGKNKNIQKENKNVTFKKVYDKEEPKNVNQQKKNGKQQDDDSDDSDLEDKPKIKSNNNKKIVDEESDDSDLEDKPKVISSKKNKNKKKQDDDSDDSDLLDEPKPKQDKNKQTKNK